MKRYLLFLLLVCTIQTVNAQTEKGKKFIDGQLNISGRTYGTLNSTMEMDTHLIDITITPGFGYFIADNFAIGANLNLGMYRSTQHNGYIDPTRPLPSKYTYTTTILSYGLGGFARYYLNITGNFKVFFNGGINYLYETQESTYSTNDPDHVNSSSSNYGKKIPTHEISIAVSPGLVYFVTPKLGIQTTIGSVYYSFSSTKEDLSYDNHENRSRFGLNLNLTSINLGLSYYF